MGVFALVFFIGVFVVWRVVMGSVDHDRIKSDIGSRGGETIDINWTPFGKGWFGDKSNRIYTVRFKDRDGIVRTATAKTSAFGGVYFAEDPTANERATDSDLTSSSDATNDRLDQLRQENERLKDELARVRETNS